MKKQYKLLAPFIIIFVFLLLIAGCGGEISESDNEDGSNENISIGAGPNGSANYITISGIASLLSGSDSNLNISTEISTGSQENIRMIQEGTTQFGIAMADAYYHAYEGTREFESDTEGSINFVMGGPQTLMHFIVPEDSGINDITDLVGSRIGTSRGVTSQYYVPIILEAYGISDDVEIVELELSDIQNGLSDRTIDAGVHITPSPNTTIQDLAATTDIKLLEVDEEIAEEIIEENPYFETGQIPGNTYSGFDQEVNTLGSRNTLIVDANLDEDIVYEITKTIIEGYDELISIHPQAGEYNKENALEGDVIPIHPGAEKYYNEINILE